MVHFNLQTQLGKISLIPIAAHSTTRRLILCKWCSMLFSELVGNITDMIYTICYFKCITMTSQKRYGGSNHLRLYSLLFVQQLVQVSNKEGIHFIASTLLSLCAWIPPVTCRFRSQMDSSKWWCHHHHVCFVADWARICVCYLVRTALSSWRRQIWDIVLWFRLAHVAVKNHFHVLICLLFT